MQQCPHDRFSIEELFVFKGKLKNYLLVLEELAQVNDECDIDITSRCTEACKTKMIAIVQATFNQYRNDLCWYYHDAKIGVDGGSSVEYLITMKSGTPQEPSPFYNFTPQVAPGNVLPNYPNVLGDQNN
ncbi:hypothetical protein ACTA71_001262 [Dictyostelium dimigraforme]